MKKSIRGRLAQQNLYWAFPIKGDLQREIRCIAEILHHCQRQHREAGASRDELVKALNEVVDSGFEFYYVRPTAERQDLSPMVRRAVDSVMNAVRRAIHLVIQRVFKKMSLEDLCVMANYLDSLAIEDRQGDTWLAYPLNTGLRDRLVSLVARIGYAEARNLYERDLVVFFADIVSESAHYYYHQPVTMINLSGFAKKATDVAIDTTVKALQSLLERVIKDLSHDAISQLPDMLDYLIVSADLTYQVGGGEFIEYK